MIQLMTAAQSPRRKDLVGAADRDHRGALAAAVWIRCLAFGPLLGAVGAVGTVALAFTAGTDLHTAAIVALVAAIVGTSFGLIVGILVGLALALLVTFGHRALGARAVSTLMPLTAMIITEPLTYVVFRGASPMTAVGMVVLDAAFTMLGAVHIARTYRRLAEPRPVH